MATESMLFTHDDRSLWKDMLEDGRISEQQYAEADQISYGEDWEGMASHVSEMHNLDRIIFEDCYCPSNGGKVSHPRLILSDGLTKYFRAEYIAKRLQCNLSTAQRFVDDWKRLDLTNSIIEKVIKGIVKKDTLATASLFFTRLAAGMPDPDLMDRNDTLEFLQEDIIESDDATSDELISSFKENEVDSVPSEYKFIPVGETGMDEAPSPLSFKYRKLIRDLNKTYSIPELKQVCQVAFNINLDNFNTNMFLRAYRNRKAEVTNHWLNQCQVFKRIHHRLCNIDPKLLNKAGNWLSKVATGKVVVPAYTPNANFTAILKDKYFELQKASQSTS